MWEWLIDTDELFFMGMFALFCIASFLFMALLFLVIYILVEICEFVSDKFWTGFEKVLKSFERRKHGRSKNYSELDGQSED